MHFGTNDISLHWGQFYSRKQRRLVVTIIVSLSSSPSSSPSSPLLFLFPPLLPPSTVLFWTGLSLRPLQAPSPRLDPCSPSCWLRTTGCTRVLHSSSGRSSPPLWGADTHCQRAHPLWMYRGSNIWWETTV